MKKIALVGGYLIDGTGREPLVIQALQSEIW